jgi:hypothetical protein
MKFKISIIIVCLFAVTSCTDDFKEINTNPNAPVEVEPSLLMRNILWESGEKLSWEGFVAGSLLAQQIALIDFNNFDRHDLTGVQFGGNPWPILYTLMRDNEIVLEQSSKKIFKIPINFVLLIVSKTINWLFIPLFSK